jgi:hypothetical protein
MRLRGPDSLAIRCESTLDRVQVQVLLGVLETVYLERLTPFLNGL